MPKITDTATKNMYRKIYFMGIKGVGMAGLAIIAKQAGIIVGGSDIDEEFITDSVLKEEGIEPVIGFSSENVDDFLQNLSSKDGLVISTGAHQGFDNPEVQYARKKGYKVISHGEAVGLFMNGDIFGRSDMEGISVAGAHGKTTITGMISTILLKLNLDPSYTVGTSEVFPIGAGGHYGRGVFFVAEADEYVSEAKYDPTPKFLYQKPASMIINNIDFDHPDYYENIEKVEEAYIEFAGKLSDQEVLVACGDDEHIKNMLLKLPSKPKIITFGTDKKNDFIITRFQQEGFSSRFEVSSGNTLIGNFNLSVPGYHNAKNALGVIALLMELGISANDIARVIPEFRGVKRRMEIVGKTRNLQTIIDDYAHHPQEIKKTLEALKSAYPDKKIVTIFQPHTFSRTKSMLSDFISSFSDTDELILMPTFASFRQESDEGQNDEEFAKSLRVINKNFNFIKRASDVVEYIDKNRTDPDLVIVTMGAGDVYKVAYALTKN